MNVIIVSASTGTLDPAACDSASGQVAAITTAPRLSAGDLSQIAWAIDTIDTAAFTSLAASLRGIFGAGSVTAITVGTPDVRAVQPADDGLQYQHQRGTIAQ